MSARASQELQTRPEGASLGRNLITGSERVEKLRKQASERASEHLACSDAPDNCFIYSVKEHSYVTLM